MLKQIIYKVADIALGGKGVKVNISGIELRLPTRYYKYYGTEYEKDSVQEMRKVIKKGETIIDIGAQLGLMTKLFSDLVGEKGQVFSFEPTPKTFSLLQETIKINNIGNIATPVQKAVSDKRGTATFNISVHEASPANSLAKDANDDSIKGIDVALISVDEFAKESKLKKVDYIKIDAEGAEFAVLKGAEKTIIKDKPNMLLALHPDSILDFGDSLEGIWDFIQKHKYVVKFEGKPIARQQFIKEKNLFDVHLYPSI